MRPTVLLATAVSVLIVSSTVALAESGTVSKTPGHMMQSPQARSAGPGASEYAPGHLKRKGKSNSASQYTPSHRATTGMRSR